MSSSTFNSRSQVILFLSTFIGLFTMLVVLSELFLRLYVVPTSHFHKHLDYYHNLDEASVVAFGDSRMSQGFYSDDPSVANLAYASESFEQISTKIEHFLKRQKPDTIILQVGHHMFADYRFDKDRRDYNIFFSNGYNWRKQPLILDPVMRGQLLKYWGLFFASKGTIGNISDFTDNGSILIDHTMEYPPNDVQKSYRTTRTNEHTLKVNYRNRQTWDILRQTIRDIRQSGINLCLISFPVTPFYKETILELKYTQEALDRVVKIAREEGVSYTSYWNLYDGRYEYFRNLDHLNATSAPIFTKKVISDCTKNK